MNADSLRPSQADVWLRQGSDTLLVLLPGALMRPSDVEMAGCLDALRGRGPVLDLCVADMAMDRVVGGAPLADLQARLLAPARAHYRQLWLGGISLGGFLSMAQACDRPDTVDGLCLIAPYPGSRVTTNQIRRAGGLASWEPDPAQRQDVEYRVWDWLRSPPATLPVFVGHGRDDRFADGMAAVAACFPPSSRHLVDGGHDWPAWRCLWQTFLDAAPFAAGRCRS
ncbi:MAG: alpha/beta hydrolase [Burkholderiaceae bacterium]